MKYIDKFKQRVEAFIKRHGMAATTFGIMAVNDPSFMLDMRQGDRSPSFRTIERVESFMLTYKKHD